MNNSVPGFNGERTDLLKDTYLLGNGYRAYNPRLMRFHCPDDWSPFGKGGLNSYVYCTGDPINLADPSGHMSWQGITGIVTGVIGLALVPLTLGQSLTAVVGLIAGLEILSGATAIASGILEEVNPRASSALGWVSFAFGVVSMGTGMAVAGIRVVRTGGFKLNRVISSAATEMELTSFSGESGSVMDSLPNELILEKINSYLDTRSLASFSLTSYRMSTLAKNTLLKRLENGLIAHIDKFRGQNYFTEEYAFLYKWNQMKNKTPDVIDVYEKVFLNHIKNGSYGPFHPDESELRTEWQQYNFHFSREHGLMATRNGMPGFYKENAARVKNEIDRKAELMQEHPGMIIDIAQLGSPFNVLIP